VQREHIGLLLPLVAMARTALGDRAEKLVIEVSRRDENCGMNT
jgi:hypothetical protein